MRVKGRRRWWWFQAEHYGGAYRVGDRCIREIQLKVLS